MTFEEYTKEKERLSDNRRVVKKFFITVFIFLIISTFFICADKCSDDVAAWCIFLNLMIGTLFFFILEKIKEKDEERLGWLFRNIK